MEREHNIVLGLSITGVAAALQIAGKGHPVTLVEIPHEIPIRARPEIWDTALSQRDRKGADFEALALRVLESRGAKVVRDLESVKLELSPSPRLILRRFDEPEPETVAGSRIIYASDGTWNLTVIPKAARELVSRGVSASAWIDATFYLGKSTAVAGAGDFAFEQLYWAAQCASELCWINPEERAMISEDLMDRIELPVIPSLRASEEVRSVRREGSLLELGLSGGGVMAVHAVFFAGPPVHEHGILDGPMLESLRRAGAAIVGTAEGAPWTQFGAQWQAGWELGEML
ncbi:MAG: hypothetical protein SFV51_21765 [Bryobacteraceae bacterium]|nr:hypothetical protein [Bryobacteraceae bacterium]